VDRQDVMNLKDLAKYLQMSEASLYHLVSEGKIPGIKVGKQWRFNKKAIDEWLNRKTQAQRTALVVDDDPMVLNSILQAIKECGLSCVGANSAKDAAALVREIAFDVVMLDVILPDGSALDIVKALKETCEHIPDVALVTAFSNSSVIEEIRLILPKVEVFAKPIRLSRILQFVRGG